MSQVSQTMDYEATALQYFLITLLPQDHPTYFTLSYSGYTSAQQVSIPITSPCFLSNDSLQQANATGRVSVPEPTGKAVLIQTATRFKIVKHPRRKVPSLMIWDAIELGKKRVVRLAISLRYHYTDYYYITLSPTYQVVSSSRFGEVW
jgi:hypothetical protein